MLVTETTIATYSRHRTALQYFLIQVHLLTTIIMVVEETTAKNCIRDVDPVGIWMRLTVEKEEIKIYILRVFFFI